MDKPLKGLYEFGAFRLDADERLLLRAGEVVPLTPKAFDVLLALVVQPGHLLEKETLLKTVWPDTFVEENNLADNISRVRKALGDGENGQKFIETVPRHGYRFVAEVRKPDTVTQGHGDAGQAIVPLRSRIAFSPRWFLVMIAPLLVLGLYYFWSNRTVASPPIKLLAVLPPRPLKPAELDEGLGMGTASLLITRLGSLRQLIVRSESAVEKYARFEQDPLAAGREQKVDVVLDIRYQRAGDKIRFTLRLLRVTDGEVLWADTLDQPSADLFALQDALSVKVTAALNLTLSDADKQLLAKRYTTSAEVWRHYAAGRYFLHRRQPLDDEKAISYFEQALALDPRFALAHTMLGKSYLSRYWEIPVPEFAVKAQTAINLALKLDDQLAEAHTHLAEYKHYYEWDYAGAEQEHRRALDLYPNSADVQHGYAFYLTFMGRFAQGIAAIRKAEELDPTDQWISRNVAQVFFFARRYDEAIAQSQRAIDLAPNSGSAYNWLSRAYELKGNEQRTFAANLKREELEEAGPEEIAEMKAVFAASGLNGYWRRRLDRLLGQEKRKAIIQRGQHEIAVCYARLGEKEQALMRLQRAVEAHELYVVALKVNPQWDSYRADPRFVALVRRVGLPQ